MRPVFLGCTYEVTTEEQEGLVALTLKSGPVPVLRMQFRADVVEADEVQEPRLGLLGLSINLLKSPQLQVLLWISRYVGMVNPGRQALLSQIEIEFDKDASGCPDDFNPNTLAAKVDARFHKVDLVGDGPGVLKFTISAFERRPPSKFDFEKLRGELGSSRDLQNEDILITGAGRGLGAALARGLALHGAKLILNIHRMDEESQMLLDDLQKIGATYEILIGDGTKTETWAKNLQKGKISQVILNAFPQIISSSFLEQDHSQVAAYAQIAHELVEIPMRSMSSRIKDDARILHLSSIYCQKPQPHFLHYSQAKSSVDEFLKRDSHAYPEREYISLKLPPLNNRERIGMQEEGLEVEVVVKHIVAMAKRSRHAGYKDEAL